jgi:hypothetical protein
MLAVVKKITEAKGKVFNSINRYDNPTHTEVFLQDSRLTSFKGLTFTYSLLFSLPNMLKQEKFSEKTKIKHGSTAIDATVVLKPTLAQEVLGWTPKIIGFVDHLEFYYVAYKAYKSLSK